MLELSLHRVSKRYAHGIDGVRDASLTAPGGRLSTLLGPSGSGKSTLLRIAAGLLPPDAGEVRLAGRAVDPQALRRQVTLVAQSGTLFPHLDVLGNVAYGLRSAGVGAASARSRAAAALELMGLAGFGARAWQQLSGGEQQRVQLARALVLEPAVLLLDEPLSNLDVRLRRQLRDEIRALQQRLGLTMVCVTHDATEAMGIADRIVVMHEGRVLQQGSPREVYDEPCCEFVAGFMGDAALFDVTADAVGELHLGPLSVPLPGGPRRPGERLTLMVRPQAWAMRAVGTGAGLAGTVRRCAWLGYGIECTVGTELGELLVADRHAVARYEPGAPVVLSLRAHGVTAIGATGEVTPVPAPPSPTPRARSGAA